MLFSVADQFTKPFVAGSLRASALASPQSPSGDTYVAPTTSSSVWMITFLGTSGSSEPKSASTNSSGMVTVTVPRRSRSIVIRSTCLQLWLLSLETHIASKTKWKNAVPVSFNAPCRGSDHTQCRDGAANVNGSARPSRAFCEVMLKVLNRDNQLRHMYVQRRWQGLVEGSATAAINTCPRRGSGKTVYPNGDLPVILSNPHRH